MYIHAFDTVADCQSLTTVLHSPRGEGASQIIFLIEKEVLNKKTEAKNGVLYKSNLKN